MPAKNMPGRKAGEDHARSQGRLRREVMRREIAGGSDAGDFAPGSNKARFSLSAERWEDQNQVVVVGSQTEE